jgi:ABC-2 type transport system permease protein
MTTTIDPSRQEPSRAGPVLRHVPPVRVLKSEWTKLRSVRSTTWSLAATFALTIGIGILATAVVAARWPKLDLIDRLRFDPVQQSLTGLLFAQLSLGVLGVLVVSAEYGTGTIRATLAAVPDRPRVLAAKVVVFAAVAFIVSEALSFSAFLIGQAILAGSTPTASLGSPGAFRAVFGGGLYLTVLGLLALGLAAIVRHTAGAISLFVGVLLILPLIVQALPTSIINAVGKFLPANIGAAVTATRSHIGEQSQLPPWLGLGMLCLYAVAALLLGGWTMVRRDA